MHPVVRIILQGMPSLVMRVATSTTGDDYCYYEKASIINSAKVTSVKFRVKIETSGSSSCQNIAVRNGTKQTIVLLKNGSVICNASGTSPYTHTMTTTNENEYEIRLNGTTNAEFYVNGVLVHTAAYTNLANDANNSIFWGDTSGSANYGGSALWRYLQYNLDYGTNPLNYVEWMAVSKPTSQGWTLVGTDLATLIEE
jgi:hypothetical protein